MEGDRTRYCEKAKEEVIEILLLPRSELRGWLGKATKG